MEAERQRGLRMYEAMIEEIESLVTQADELGGNMRLMWHRIPLNNHNFSFLDLDTTTFYFISTSMFYDCNENIFPAELAVAKFNLKDGVYQDIQIRINPGELPLGARHDAQEISNKIHQYPLPPNCDGEKDYMTMLETMIRFIHPLDKLPVFFTEGYDTKKDSMSKTRKIVERIFYESAEDDMMADVKIYPIEYLFQILQRATITNINRLNDTNEKPFSSISFAANKFYNNQYEYSAHGCQFHYDKDCTQHCCLSKVRRYGYMMAEYCANKDRFPLQEGQHYPRGYNPK